MNEGGECSAETRQRVKEEEMENEDGELVLGIVGTQSADLCSTTENEEDEGA